MGVLYDKALAFATDAHVGQKDKKDPTVEYIEHPIWMSRQFDKDGLAEVLAVLSLLHDTYEDTDVTLEDIEREFGKYIRDLVDNLSRRDGESKHEALQRAKLHPLSAVAKLVDSLSNARVIRNPLVPRDIAKQQDHYIDNVLELLESLGILGEAKLVLELAGYDRSLVYPDIKALDDIFDDVARRAGEMDFQAKMHSNVDPRKLLPKSQQQPNRAGSAVPHSSVLRRQDTPDIVSDPAWVDVEGSPGLRTWAPGQGPSATESNLNSPEKLLSPDQLEARNRALANLARDRRRGPQPGVVVN